MGPFAKTATPITTQIIKKVIQDRGKKLGRDAKPESPPADSLSVDLLPGDLLPNFPRFANPPATNARTASVVSNVRAESTVAALAEMVKMNEEQTINPAQSPTSRRKSSRPR